MKVRAVTRADVEALVALWAEVFPEYGDRTRPQRDARANIERKLAFGDGLFWLAQQDAAVIGSALAGYDGHRGWLYAVGVQPAQRGRGVARALVAIAEAELKRRGCPKVNLQVLSNKAVEQAFWQALGYREDLVRSLGKRLV